MSFITLKRDAKCKACNAELKAGWRARWYRNGDVYGVHCHNRDNTPTGASYEESMAGTKWEQKAQADIAKRGYVSAPPKPERKQKYEHCTCEDYPCCGHERGGYNPMYRYGSAEMGF